MSPSARSRIRDVDFTTPGSVDPSDFGLEGLTSAAARLSVDLSPTSGLGVSRLGQVRRIDGSALSASGRCWFSLRSAAGPGVLLMDQSLAVVVADLLMGGAGRVDPRALTAVEERVLVPHLQRSMGPLGGAFAPAGLAPLEVRDPGRGSLGIRGDMLMVEVVVCDSADEEARTLGSLFLVVPSPVMARHASQAAAHGQQVHGLAPFLEVPLAASLSTLATAVPASSLGLLAAGGLLRTRHPVDVPLRLEVSGIPLADAVPGQGEQALTARVRTVWLHSLPGSPAVPGRPRRVSSVLSTPASSAVPPSAVRGTEESLTGPDLRPVSGPALPGSAGPSSSTPLSPSQFQPTIEGEQLMSIDSPASPGSPMAAALAAAEHAVDALDGSGLPSRVPVPGETAPGPSLGVLADVPVEVTVEVGRASITLRDAVSLSPGQVVTLDAQADSLASVLVNGKVVARGQVVVVDDVYGVRITEMASE